MTERELNTFICDIIRDKLPAGSVVARAKQNAPRPDASTSSPLFATVNVISLVSEGLEDKFDADLPEFDIERTHVAMARSLISINVSGYDARQYAKLIRIYFVQEKQRALFASVKVGLIKRSGIRDLTKIRHADFEERAQLDIEVYYQFEDTETVTSVESIRVVGTLEEGSNEYTITIEEPIP